MIAFDVHYMYRSFTTIEAIVTNTAITNNYNYF